MNIRILPNCHVGGVSHTPENVHVDKLAHLDVCNTPLHWLFADIHNKLFLRVSVPLCSIE